MIEEELKGGWKKVEGVVFKDGTSGEERKAFAPLTFMCDGVGSSFRSKLCDMKETPTNKVLIFS